LFFDQAAAALALPLDAATVVNTVAVPVTAGNEVKIDTSQQLDFVTAADWGIDFNVNISRDGTVIDTQGISRDGAAAGTQRFIASVTVVDVPAETGTATYTVTIEPITATNVTAATSENRKTNIIRFV